MLLAYSPDKRHYAYDGPKISCTETYARCYIRHIHIAGKKDRDNNNKMERLNGEIRDREKVFRGLKRFDTPLIDGMKTYYNFTKKHGSLNGKTPAEASKIIVDGRNKWITLIQNASLYKENSE